MMNNLYVKECPKCASKKLGGFENEFKQCLSCGNLWIEPIPESPQVRFLACGIREVGFGGEAGGSKSFSLTLDAMYQLAKKDYHALLLRRTYKQLTGDDGLVTLSKKIYPIIGGRFRQSDYLWEFSDYPGTIRFGHIEHEKDLEQSYEGHQYSYLGFDELQTFTERMYLYLFSRNRASNPDIKLYTRSTFMPGGIGHHWVKKRFIQPFQNGGGYINSSKYFRRVNGRDTEVGSNDDLAIERIFIPAHLEDNPYLWQDGKGAYIVSLHQLDTVDFARKRGDWDIRREGRVYHSFTDASIGPDSRDLDVSKIAGYYHSHDFGAVNHIWGLWAKIGSQYYLVHEQQLPEGTTSSKATHIKRIFGDKKIVVGYGGSGSENQYRLDFGREGVIIRLPSVPKKTPQDQIVEYQVRKTNRFFEQKTLMICSDMVMTIDQLENCVRDEKEGIQDKAQWHYCDMVRYFSSGLGMGVFVG
jgi:hypothetical protein